MDPKLISVKKQDINATGGELVIESDSLKQLVETDKDLAIKLINENGVNLTPERISIDANGKVIILDNEFKESLRSRIVNPDFVALNICGLCKVS